MWDNVDKQNYSDHVINNLGQICNDDFSSEITKYASNLQYKNFIYFSKYCYFLLNYL